MQMLPLRAFGARAGGHRYVYEGPQRHSGKVSEGVFAGPSVG